MAKDEMDRKPGSSRRRFCQVAGVSACAVAAGGTGILTADFLQPRVLFEPPTRFVLGPPDSVAIGSVLTEQTQKVYIIRSQAGFRALSSICTHLGCITRYQPDEKVIACPCHGSRFNLEGEVIAGPAPRALDQYEIDVSSRGRLVVDKSVAIPQGTTVKL